MRKNLLTTCVAVVAVAGLLQSQTTVTDSLNYTGAMQTYTVPCGVTSITIECFGAQGAAGDPGGQNSSGGAGGSGGYATGTLSVTPGQILNVFVGGAGSTSTGGFNGGGTPGVQTAGGGGGASDVRVNGTAAADRVIVAGGGGGGGRGGCEPNSVAGGAGGAGGGANGSNGVTSPNGGGGFGGTLAGGGAAGIGCSGYLGQPGVAGTAAGVGGAGGAGQSCCCFTFGSIPGGGGGGGGFAGGGGGGGGSAGTTSCSGNDKGGGGGGAGGSNYIGGVTSGSETNGVRTGNGVVKISYTQNPQAPTIAAVPSSMCYGDTATLSVNNVASTTYTWTTAAGFTIISGQGTDVITVVATGMTGGTFDVTATTTCGTSPATTTSAITINALPTLTAGASSSAICIGSLDTLYAVTDGISYAWSSGGTGSVELVAPTGTTPYTVTVTGANGCTNDTTFTVVVNALPVLTASGDTAICNGGTVTMTVSGATQYSWSSGGTGSTETVSPTDTTAYTVTGTDANGCSSMETVIVTVNPLPVITVSADTAICNGGTATMTVSGTSQYSWSSGGTGSSETVSPSSTTTYTVTGTSAEGCTATAMVTVNVNSNPTVTFALPGGIHCVADGNFALTGGSPAGGTYSGTAVTAGSFSPSTAGVGSFGITYAYTDTNGCSSSAMDTIAVSACVGIDEANNVYGLTLMPNPATDNLHVTWDPNKAAVTTLEVYDNAGRLVMTSKVNGGNSADIDVTSLPAGNYSLSVTTIDSKGTYQFIKK